MNHTQLFLCNATVHLIQGSRSGDGRVWEFGGVWLISNDRDASSLCCTKKVALQWRSSAHKFNKWFYLWLSCRSMLERKMCQNHLFRNQPSCVRYLSTYHFPMMLKLWFVAMLLLLVKLPFLEEARFLMNCVKWPWWLMLDKESNHILACIDNLLFCQQKGKRRSNEINLEDLGNLFSILWPAIPFSVAALIMHHRVVIHLQRWSNYWLHSRGSALAPGRRLQRPGPVSFHKWAVQSLRWDDAMRMYSAATVPI